MMTFSSYEIFLRIKSLIGGVCPRIPRQVCRFVAPRLRSADMTLFPFPAMSVSKPIGKMPCLLRPCRL